MLKKIKNSSGETIVEVLICIAILSIGMGTAFLISDQSVKTSLSNEEQYQAQLYANTQVNLLQAYLLTVSNGGSGNGLIRSQVNFQFCLNQSGTLTQTSDLGWPANCQQKSPTTGATYTFKITNLGNQAGRIFNNYDVNVSWNNNYTNAVNKVDVLYGE